MCVRAAYVSERRLKKRRKRRFFFLLCILRCPIFVSHHDGVKSVSSPLYTKASICTPRCRMLCADLNDIWKIYFPSIFLSTFDPCISMCYDNLPVLCCFSSFDHNRQPLLVASHFSFIQMVNSLENYIRSVISPTSLLPLNIFSLSLPFHHPENERTSELIIISHAM